ncbi:hypothetical protein MTR67_038457 [Solanum verrucosum]|uniref:Gag-pol polyprotein n=1 Tax=Solanum verrucosum TaxID=315347 RepID=A0AAF0UFI4_SOLVR|nr:hypothetical protein MTR67_038457 [Solanum verrucosum]
MLYPISSTRIGCQTPTPQESGGNGSSTPALQRCGKSHSGKCLADIDDCFSYGNSGHTMRDCLAFATKERDNRKAQPSGSGLGAPRQNRFYAFHTQQDHKGSLDVVTDMLEVFHFDVYALLDLGVTLSFVTYYVAMRFDIGLEILSNSFSIYIL